MYVCIYTYVCMYVCMYACMYRTCVLLTEPCMQQTTTCNQDGIVPNTFNLPDQPIQGTQAECEQLCLEQSECQAFSWPVSVAPTTQHNCWLKTSSLASVQCQGSGCWMTVQVKGCEACSVADANTVSAACNYRHHGVWCL